MDVPAHCYSTDNAGIMWLLKWLGVNMHHCNPPPLPVLEIEYKDQSRIGGSRGRNIPNRILLKLYVEAILKYW